MTWWPFRHLSLKIWSVVLAIMLWIVIAGEETVERALRVPLELQQFPAGLEVQGDAPSLIDVRVRGESGTLSRLGTGDIMAVLDLGSARPGRRLYQITPEQVRVPFGVEVVQVTPPSLTLVFEHSATRRVPIVPAVEGEPAPGFVIGKLTTQPEQVDVVGPESAIEAVTEALTEPVSVAGARENVSESVMVGFQDPILRLKAPRPAVVTVEIVPGPVERTLLNRPVRVRGLGPSLSAHVAPPMVDVVVRGTREGLDRLDASAIDAFVDLAGLGAGEYSLSVRVEPGDAGASRINPATVQVRIASAKP